MYYYIIEKEIKKQMIDLQQWQNQQLEIYNKYHVAEIVQKYDLYHEKVDGYIRRTVVYAIRDNEVSGLDLSTISQEIFAVLIAVIFPPGPKEIPIQQIQMDVDLQLFRECLMGPDNRPFLITAQQWLQKHNIDALNDVQLLPFKEELNTIVQQLQTIQTASLEEMAIFSPIQIALDRIYFYEHPEAYESFDKGERWLSETPFVVLRRWEIQYKLLEEAFNAEAQRIGAKKAYHKLKKQFLAGTLSYPACLGALWYFQSAWTGDDISYAK